MFGTWGIPFSDARVDHTYGRPELTAARDAVGRRDLSAVTLALTSTVDHDVRADITYVAAEELVRLYGPEIPEWAETWYAAANDDGIAWTLRGAHEVLRAWKIRGYQRARYTDAATFRSFGEALQGAEVMCRRAVQLCPDDPVPWVLLVHMARGQEIGPAGTLERFSELTSRSDAHLRGNEQMVLSLSPKWGTPFRVLEGTIDHQRRTAPAGSPIHLNTVQAYIELWFNLPVSERGELTGKDSVRMQAEEAISGWLEEGITEGRHALHNFAGFWYTITGQHSLAKPHFAATAGYVKEFPWSYKPFPVLSYQRGRRAARKS
ncbi:hypothetical protein [Streptomyces nojiriensis]|uniref:hypothetical protein n=1 Tax=Streptomyces nojiriensis TaxID=66374 RepID=UPI0036693B38